MNILVVGGYLTPGIPEGESFPERVAQYLADAQAMPVVLDFTAPACTTDALHLLLRLPLRLTDYDLILLTPGIIHRTESWLGSIGQVRRLGTQTRQLLNLLHPHRERVLVLGPMPCLPLVANGFQRWASFALTMLCRRYAFRLVDGFGTLPRQEFMFAPDGQTLNRLGHHYLALGLIDVLDQEAVGTAAVVQ